IWLRAVAQNQRMASALGLPVPRIYAVAFVVSAALAAVAGSLLVPLTGVYPTVGLDITLNAFIVVIAGGLGNFRGAALIALGLGVGASCGVAAYVVAMPSRRGVLNPFELMLAALASGVLVSGLFAIYAVVATGLEYLLLTLLTTSAFFTLPLLAVTVTGGENGLGVEGPVQVSFGLDPLQGSGFYWLL